MVLRLYSAEERERKSSWRSKNYIDSAILAECLSDWLGIKAHRPKPLKHKLFELGWIQSE
jgi:hypothetical protein